MYNPLPNGLHGRWTLAALDAGKHVLCEKPFTANADEAEKVAAAAASSGLVVMEAFHYRYHPLIARVLEILRGGELGSLRRVDTRMCFPLPFPHDIRYQLDLAGGATMDAGCYAIHQARTLAGVEPTVHRRAGQNAARPGSTAGCGRSCASRTSCTGSVESALDVFPADQPVGRVEGERGPLADAADEPDHTAVLPSPAPRDPATGTERRRKEHVEGGPTYVYQLRAFAAAVREGAPFPTTPADAVANMKVIDAAYRTADLKPRGTR